MNARAMMLILCAVVAASPATAQTLDRSQRPVAPPQEPFKFPHQQTITLPNGLRVVVVESHALPLVAVRAVVGVDSLQDPAGKQGLYDLTARMLREGTTTLSAEAIGDTIAMLGSDVGPFRFTTLASNLDRSLSLMAAMLAHPAFPDAALERAKAALTGAEQAQLQSAAPAPRRVLFDKLFGAEHPVARSVISPPADIASITRDDVARFHDVWFRPNNTTLVVVGDVRASHVMDVVRAAFGEWKRQAVPSSEYPKPPTPVATSVYLIDIPNAPQTYTYVGALGPARGTSDYAALQVLAQILGATPGSRMQQDLRERHSYYYSGTPFTIVWRPAPLASMMYGSAALSAAKTDSGLVAWLRDIREMREQPPTEQEMTLARGSLIGTLPEQIETDDGVADRIVFLAQNHLPASFYDTYVKSVTAVTSKDVISAARKYLDPEHLVIVLAGDRKLLEPRLRAANIGPVTIVQDK